jgi:hypothetical protein
MRVSLLRMANVKSWPFICHTHTILKQSHSPQVYLLANKEADQTATDPNVRANNQNRIPLQIPPAASCGNYLEG